MNKLFLSIAAAMLSSAAFCLNPITVMDQNQETVYYPKSEIICTQIKRLA